MFSPLEQFELISLFRINAFGLDFSIINSSFIFFINLFYIYILFSPFLSKLKVIPTNGYQLCFEQFYIIVQNILVSNSGLSNQFYFPVIFNLASFLSISNFIGLIPFGFTVTSHILITLALSFSIFFSINFLGVKKHRMKFLGLFLPSGTPFAIMPFLFLIELLSYVSRVFSLAIRLFANMMSGHTLLKILTSFLFSSLTLCSFYLFLNVLPIALLHVIIGMEICIAILQVYVFLVLSCLYLNDITHIGH